MMRDRCPICGAPWSTTNVARCVCGYDHGADSLREAIGRLRSARTAGVAQLIVGCGLMALILPIASVVSGGWTVVAIFGLPALFAIAVAGIVRGAARTTAAVRKLRTIRAMQRLPVARVRT